MKIKIFGNSPEALKLFDVTKQSLDDIGLSDFVSVEQIESEEYKKELNISKDPAFCVEEEMIEFKDTIFEWTVPSKEEMDSLLVSLIWWESSSSCSSWCWTCSTWC
ncbi:MAG: hypothetical protein ACD_3C00037G0016 [uncultured bacterium (gcode 4)]|uniref:Uncharacterized protein n=1 Tax=uncultured bacterium (gcode 4) TaxID=1234023 RepID=K2GYW5_9BACT|nr:MAG: hypothetical protein ACD_3C00037G0016 [uncultured bacterium (gcode 4)]